MSLVLHDLLACCRGLESDKATERKVNVHLLSSAKQTASSKIHLFLFSQSMPPCLQKEAERFRRLLQNAEVVQELDRGSGSKARGSKQLTWDAVFRYLLRLCADGV